MDNKTGGKILTDKLEIDYLWNYKENNFKLLNALIFVNIFKKNFFSILLAVSIYIYYSIFVSFLFIYLLLRCKKNKLKFN